ncbi:MAG: sulfatase-like hydrolase/transferase [Candidatus Aminicenantes bacterium]
MIITIIVSVSVSFVGCNKKKVTGKKQIILIGIDTLRGDHLSSYGYFRDTSPHLSQLIEDSVYYANAYPNGCWTMPSHVSLLTGTLPSRHGINKGWGSIVKNKKYPKPNESIKNIAQVLKNHQKNIKTVKKETEISRETIKKLEALGYL